jgi:ribosomal-protein-alanine N-acetyltransferase
MNTCVKPLDASGFSEVVALEQASEGGWGEDALRAEWRLDWSQTWGVFDEGCLKAYAVVWWVQDTCEIIYVMTGVQNRRRGYAKRMLQEVLQEARRRGCVKVLLEVSELNKVARGLYEGLGFKQVGVRKGYYRNGAEDALLLDVLL